MKRRCTPHLVQKTHLKSRSWRIATHELNALFGVDLPHLIWRDYATGRRDIADPQARAALGLDPRPCPRCGKKADLQITRLLKRLTMDDLKHWEELRKARKYKQASRFLEEVYRRKIPIERR